MTLSVRQIGLVMFGRAGEKRRVVVGRGTPGRPGYRDMDKVCGQWRWDGRGSWGS